MTKEHKQPPAPEGAVWAWDMIGDNIFTVFTYEVSAWRRWKTWLLMGSRWYRVNQ